MELRQLRYFVAVAEDLHFRRAAERFYVAQPAISEQIRKLEAELGVQVFDRTPRGVVLTAAGSALLEEARRMLLLAETAQHAARTAHQRATSRLRIAYPLESLPVAVPRGVRRLAAHAPNVEVTSETGPALKLLEAVRERRADAALAALPAPVDGLRTTVLGDEHLVAAVPVSDDRALEPTLTLERLASSRLLLPPRDANPAFHIEWDLGITPTPTTGDRTMFTTSRINSLFAQRSHAEALEAWREAEGTVRVRWQAFLEAPGPGSRSRAFRAYVTALDAEEAAASELAALSSYDIAA